MLRFDYSCGRESPSVAAMIYPFDYYHTWKFFWGTKETLLPVYTSVKEAVEKHPDADVVVNFASSHSVFGSTQQILGFPQPSRSLPRVCPSVMRARSCTRLRRRASSSLVLRLSVVSSRDASVSLTPEE